MSRTSLTRDFSDDRRRNLRNQIDELGKRLRKETVYVDQLDKQFVPSARLRTVLNRDAIHKLLGVYSSERSTDEVDQAVGRAEADFLRTLATLVTSFDQKSLTKLIHHLLRIDVLGPFRTALDEELPLSSEDAERRFGQEKGRSFYHNQFIFCAIEFEEGKDHNVVRNVRLPFKYKRAEEGRGAVGIVYSVTIARGHWTDKDGSMSNSQSERVFAQKVFSMNNKNNEKERKFRGELQKLKDLKANNKVHKNITYHLASLEQPAIPEFSLFYELANQSLVRFLATSTSDDVGNPLDRWVWTRKAAIMKNATDVLDALASLHDFRPDCAVYHFDISPNNILVYGKGEDAIWKLSDFDLSEFKYTKDWYEDTVSSAVWNPHDRSSIICAQEPGSYRAPEVFRGSHVGPGSDVWSFACILSLVLSYLHQGPRGVHRFMQARSRDELGAEVDYFYERVSPLGPSKGVYDGVVAWFKELKEKQECPRHAKYVEQITECLLSEVFDQPDTKRRITAKHLHMAVLRAYDRYKHASEQYELNQDTTEQNLMEQDHDGEENVRIPTLSANQSEFSSLNSSWISDQQPALSSSSAPRSHTPSLLNQTISIAIPSPATPPMTPVPPPTAPPLSPVPSIDLVGPSQERISIETIVRVPSRPASNTMPSPTQDLSISPIGPPISPQQTNPTPPLCALCTAPRHPPLPGLLNDCTRDPNAKCRGCGKTPLQRAVNCTDRDVLRKVLAAHPNIDLEQKCGSRRTILMECCYKRQVDSALTLKEKGAKLDKVQFRAMKDIVPRPLWNAFKGDL
jgi:hypothetical protein